MKTLRNNRLSDGHLSKKIKNEESENLDIFLPMRLPEVMQRAGTEMKVETTILHEGKREPSKARKLAKEVGPDPSILRKIDPRIEMSPARLEAKKKNMFQSMKEIIDNALKKE